MAVTALIGSQGGERRLIRINATCAIFNVAIMIPVIPVYGLIGAAAVTVVTEVLRLVLAFRFAGQEGFRPPKPTRFAKPTLAAAGMALALVLMGERSFPVLVATGVATYAILLLALGVLKLGRPFQVRVVV
jgi:O-antigen/teichoic acid export membrane protein